MNILTPEYKAYIFLYGIEKRVDANIIVAVAFTTHKHLQLKENSV